MVETKNNVTTTNCDLSHCVSGGHHRKRKRGRILLIWWWGRVQVTIPVHSRTHIQLNSHAHRRPGRAVGGTQASVLKTECSQPAAFLRVFQPQHTRTNKQPSGTLYALSLLCGVMLLRPGLPTLCPSLCTAHASVRKGLSLAQCLSSNNQASHELVCHRDIRLSGHVARTHTHMS
jgi:hypothetical protein